MRQSFILDIRYVIIVVVVVVVVVVIIVVWIEYTT